MRWNLLSDYHRNSNTVLRSQKDTQRSGSESEAFLNLSEFFFFFFFILRATHRREKGRDQIAESRCGLISTRCLARGRAAASLLSTGPWHPPTVTSLSSLTVAHTDHRFWCPCASMATRNLCGTIISYWAKPIIQLDSRNLQVATSKKEHSLKGIYLLMWLSSKESTCQCKRRGLNPSIRKIPQRR